MSEPNDSLGWTPLVVSDRAMLLGMLNEFPAYIMLSAGAVVVVALAFIYPGWRAVLFASFFLALLAGVLWFHARWWWKAAQYKFFEEGITVGASRNMKRYLWRDVSAVEFYPPWALDLFYVRTRMFIVLRFSDGSKIWIPLQVFAKARSLCDAIVERVPVTIERPSWRLKDSV